MSDPLGKHRSEAAVNARVADTSERKTTRKVARFGNQVHTVTHYEDPRGMGAARQATQAVAAVGATAATLAGVTLSPFILSGAAIYGATQGDAKESVKSAVVLPKKMWTKVRDITKEGDAKRLASFAARIIPAAVALPVSHTKAGEILLKGHGEVVTRATYAERIELRKKEKQQIGKAGYDHTSAKSVAAYLNEMQEAGRAFTENGKLIYVDESNKRFLMAECSADGRAVPSTARAWTVTRRSFSKDKSVSIKELYRYAKAFALGYDDIMEKWGGHIDKLSGAEVMNSAFNFLQGIDGKVVNIKARKVLHKYLKHGQAIDDREHAILKKYLARVPLELAPEGIEHKPGDRAEELEIRTAIAQMADNDQVADHDDYFRRYGIEKDVASVKKHLEAQELRHAEIVDHMQCCVLEDSGIEYTEIGKENDRQAEAVEAAMDEKLGRLAATIYPNGVQELETIKELADGNYTNLQTELYLDRAGLRSADGSPNQEAIEKHLEELQKRYKVTSKDQLKARMGIEIAQANEIFKAGGARNLQAQALLLRALDREVMSAENQSVITHYLKREGIVPERFSGEIQDFQNAPEINRAKLDRHLDVLMNRYGIGQRRLSMISKQNTLLSANNASDLARAANTTASFKEYLQDHGIIARDHRGNVEEGHINFQRAENWQAALVGESGSATKGDLVQAQNQELAPIMQAMQNPAVALKAKISTLQNTPEKAAVTKKQEAIEKMEELYILRDIWQITTSEKQPADFSEERRDELTRYLKARGAPVADQLHTNWYRIDWSSDPMDSNEVDFREDLQEARNIALEEVAEVVNTGGENANQHVLGAINDKIRDLRPVANGQSIAIQEQVQSHKQWLKGNPPMQVTMNAARGSASILWRKKFDFGSKGWKEKEHFMKHTISLSSGVKKSVQELWTDTNSDRPLIPKQPEPKARQERKRRQRLR